MKMLVLDLRWDKQGNSGNSTNAADGKMVKTLAIEYQAAGIYYRKSHAAYWDGKNPIGEFVASGLYYCTLYTGEFIATRKMLILK